MIIVSHATHLDSGLGTTSVVGSSTRSASATTVASVRSSSSTHTVSGTVVVCCLDIKQPCSVVLLLDPLLSVVEQICWVLLRICTSCIALDTSHGRFDRHLKSTVVLYRNCKQAAFKTSCHCTVSFAPILLLVLFQSIGSFFHCSMASNGSFAPLLSILLLLLYCLRTVPTTWKVLLLCTDRDGNGFFLTEIFFLEDATDLSRLFSTC